MPLTEFILEVRAKWLHQQQLSKCTAAELEFLSLNFPFQHSHEFGDKDAFVDGPTGRSIKYSELANRIGGAAEVSCMPVV
jgi:hypothetical protein